MRRMATRVFVLTAVIAIVALAGTSPAFAHEARKVGRWNFTVGWATEPTYAGFVNGVELLLHDANGKAVEDLGDTLKVDVTAGGKTTTLSFEPAFDKEEGFGVLGDYRAKIIPTRAGTYVFRFNGTIKGDKIDATFSCSDKTFDCVAEPGEAQFPAQDPSNAQLAERIDKEAARLAAATKSATDEAKLGKILGYVGIGLGALALILVVARGRRPKAGGTKAGA